MAGVLTELCLYIWRLGPAPPWIGGMILISIEPPPLTHHPWEASDSTIQRPTQISTCPRATKQGHVNCRCHVPFQWSQHREQSQRRVDTKKTKHDCLLIIQKHQIRRDIHKGCDENGCLPSTSRKVQPALFNWSTSTRKIMHFSWSTSTYFIFLLVDRRRPFYSPFHHALHKASRNNYFKFF